MAIFNNGNDTHQGTKTDTNTTIITAGSVIKGEMKLACNLYVDGIFDGTILSDAEINIGKNGHIKGEITTHRLIVQGFVEGSISAERVEIRAQGKVQGSIESSELVIEAKAVFEGNSLVKKQVQVEKKEIKAPQVNKS